MRTTVTLDDDVVRIIRSIMRAEDKSFKQAINDALRRSAQPAPPRRRRRFRVRPHCSAFAAGVDPARLNQLVDQIEFGSAVGTQAIRRSR